MTKHFSKLGLPNHSFSIDAKFVQNNLSRRSQLEKRRKLKKPPNKYLKPGGRRPPLLRKKIPNLPPQVVKKEGNKPKRQLEPYSKPIKIPSKVVKPAKRLEVKPYLKREQPEKGPLKRLEVKLPKRLKKKNQGQGVKNPQLSRVRNFKAKI